MKGIARLATVMLLSALFGCSSGGGTGVDASGTGGHVGAGGGAGAASSGAAGSGGQAGSSASAGAPGGGHSGSQGGGGGTATGAGGSAQGGAGGATFSNCNVSYNCPAGQTCSATNNGQDFACVPSGSSKVGDACSTDPSMITCGDQLICAIITAGGQCVQLCDTDHPCPAGKTCMAEHTQADQPLGLCLATTGN